MKLGKSMYVGHASLNSSFTIKPHINNITFCERIFLNVYQQSQKCLISHAPNADTVLGVENKTFVRLLLDVQEYPVAKGNIIKMGFDSEAAVERYVAYIHGLSQLHGCPRYTGDRIKLCT